ncbi:MAG: DUF2231 domain-containing protein [Phycisphaeraceae bacterium]
MRTRSTFKGHPIHPMLIGFPIAFLTAAFVCDVVGLALGGEAWWTVGAYLALAGIVTGLAAAVPGVIDYLFSVPPHSSAKKRATYHMLVNTGAIAAFLIALIVRGDPAAPPPALSILLELAGLGLLSAGGWMGGTLVYRNFIGPEHRYAQAGKWSEQELELKPGEPVIVGRVDELKIDQMKLLHLDGRRIVLARTEQGYTAFDDHCTHRGGPLADGVLMCGKVHCKWHGSQFNVHTGQAEAGPATDAITTYRIEEHDNDLRLVMEESGSSE